MQHGGEATSEPIASTSSQSNALIPSNLNGHHAHVQGLRPGLLDVSDPLALQWSLAHLSSLIRKALRSIQGEDDVSSSDSSSDDVDNCSNASEYGGDGTTSQVSASKEPLQSQLQNIASALSTQQNQSSSSGKSVSSQTSQQRHHGDTKHDEGEGGYVRLLFGHGYDKSTAALERDIEMERLRKENETLREMLAVANEVPLPPAGTQLTSVASAGSS